VGIGGIMNSKDALEFFLAGASMIQVGTANFVDPKASIKILDGLKEYCENNRIKRIKDLVGKLEI
jgi:dihydroorotate dehydrogenase (NAD+) catalytic subunit